MLQKVLLTLLLIISGTTTSLLQAQTETDSTQLYVITKHDGKEYIGVILSDDGREVLIQTEKLGKLYIQKSDIRSMEKVEDEKQIVRGEFKNSGPFTTRYCFTTNALPIVKGEDYGLINLYGPEIHFAVNNRFSIGLMATWLASPLVLAMKYSIPTNREKLNFSVGTLLGTSGYLNQFRGYGGLHFANVTLGDRMQNITFSAGYAYATGGGKRFEYVDGTYVDSTSYNYYYPGSIPFPIPMVEKISPFYRGPIFSIAGISKISAKASFVFDSMVGVFAYNTTSTSTKVIREPNWNTNTTGIYEVTVERKSIKSTALFVMPGMRFQTTDRKAFQIALAGVSVFNDDDSQSFPFPMCTWFYRF
ncbi:MAG: hypothetical protein LW750_05405 [Bacteroidetes bacterium]|nr:hypothetical protein [Bacteroidota bacterium]